MFVDRVVAAANNRLVLVIATIAVCAEIAVVLLIPVFVTVDGAAHVGAAAALWSILTGSGDAALTFTELHWSPFTNLIPEVPMALLTGLVGPDMAEKVMLTVYVAALPIAALYALTGIRRGSGWLAVLVIPLTFNLMLIFGFFSFSYALIGFLVVVGYHARHRAHLQLRDGVVLSLLITLTYLAHPFVFGEAVLLLATFAVADWISQADRSLRTLIRGGLVLAAIALPGALLFAVAVLDRVGGASPAAQATSLFALQVLPLIESVTLVHGIVSFDQSEAVFTVGLAVVLVAALVAWLRPGSGIRRGDIGYPAFLAILILQVAFLNPDVTFWSGGPGGFLTNRLAVLAALAVILWLASVAPVRPSLVVTVLAIVAAIGITAIRLPTHIALSDHALGFTSIAPCVAQGATFAQVNVGLVPLASRRTDPLTQEVGRLAAATDGWDLGNVESAVGIFPLRNLSAVDPFRFLRSGGGLPETVDPAIDPLGYERRTGESVDYVLVFGRPTMSTEVGTSSAWMALSGQLETAYRHVLTADDGWLEVWERVGSSAAERGQGIRDASTACAQLTAP